MTKDDTNSLQKLVIHLKAAEARQYFLRQEKYFNAKLPPYFNFSKLLKELSEILKEKPLKDIKEACESDSVNYKLLTNKDGNYAWRLLQLIHPAIYVSLVHKITEPKSWNLIINKLKKYQKENRVECVSLPVASEQKEQIKVRWEQVEKIS